ncbi:MAG: glycine cleavage system aminomethyltransferase GcvT [Planctomycetota bacterium]
MQRTVLNPVHRDLGARLVEFGGFEMPVQYSSIVEEHLAVRRCAGLFDLCHMGRLEVTGPAAVAAVDRIVTCHVAKQELGQIRYALVLNEAGGVHDDILVYRLPESVLLVVNAGNRNKLWPYLTQKIAEVDGAKIVDRSEEIAMIAVQGPASERMLSPLVTTTWTPSLSQLGYYHMSDARVVIGREQFEGWVSRTGYTGEDGFELYVPSERAIALWAALQSALGKELLPCGLGARDTLRMEAGMPLYGHELEEDISPLEAGLAFAVKLKKPVAFVGRDALIATQRAGGPLRELRGFTVDGKRVARQGMGIFAGAQQVGLITSGAPSPTLERNIAMGLVARREAPEGVQLEVDVRGHRVPLTPHPVPFYKRGESP